MKSAGKMGKKAGRRITSAGNGHILAGKRFSLKKVLKNEHFDSRSTLNIKLDYPCIGKIETKDRLQLGYFSFKFGWRFD